MLRVALEGACRGGDEASRGRVESRLEALASAFEEDLTCDAKSKGTSCCELEGPRPGFSQAGTRRLSEGDCLKVWPSGLSLLMHLLLTTDRWRDICTSTYQ